MAVDGIPEPVRRLVSTHVKSVEQLDVLLLLRESAGRDWSAEEVSRRLQRDVRSAGVRLSDLAGRGFLASTDAVGRRYRYAPSSAELSRTVDELAEAYARRRHAVVRLIFASPGETIRSFGEGFRFGRE